jgi:hypothetical protein
VTERIVSRMRKRVFPSRTTGAGAGFAGAGAVGAEGAGTTEASFGGAAVAAAETSTSNNVMINVLRHVTV